MDTGHCLLGQILVDLGQCWTILVDLGQCRTDFSTFGPMVEQILVVLGQC